MLGVRWWFCAGLGIIIPILITYFLQLNSEIGAFIGLVIGGFCGVIGICWETNRMEKQ